MFENNVEIRKKGGEKVKRKGLLQHLSVWLIFGIVILMLMPGLAATSGDVTINATPAFIGITNSPNNWTMNGDYGGSGVIYTDTVYYTNPWGDEQAPNSTVAEGDCRFNITNSSTVATDITVTIGNFTGGDAMQNSNVGTNTASEFGAYSWCEDMSYASKVIAMSAGSAVTKDGLAALTHLHWGCEIETPSGAWTSADAMTATMTVSAAEDT